MFVEVMEPDARVANSVMALNPPLYTIGVYAPGFSGGEGSAGISTTVTCHAQISSRVEIGWGGGVSSGRETRI